MLALGHLITAVVSPFTNDASRIGRARFATLIAHLIATGSDGLLIGGTTGEGPTLTDEEFLTLVTDARRLAPPEIKVMANIGTNCTRTTIERARTAREAGADSLLVVCPYYNKPPQEGLIAHYQAIAATTTLPIVIYNIPGRTAVNMLPETVQRLAAETPSIVGIKEACGDIAQIGRVIELCASDTFSVWSGDDGLTAEVMALGGIGAVSVLAHVVGRQLRALIDAAVAGDLATARAHQAALQPIIQAAFCTTNPIPIKTMLNLMGIPVGPVRLPLVAPSADQRQQIEQALSALVA